MDPIFLVVQIFVLFSFNQHTPYLKVSTLLLVIHWSLSHFHAGGAKIVSLNEKQRGFPSGLRVMASQKYDYCLFEVKASLEEARFQEGEWMPVQLVEVWGCGGVEGEDTQRRIKEWEKREVVRRREV